MGSYVTIDKQLSHAILLQTNLSSTIPTLKTRAERRFKGKSVGESETEAVKFARSARYALTRAIISRKMETSCITDVFIFPGKPL